MTREEIEALRSVLKHALGRGKRARSTIAQRAMVSATDIDNFTRQRPGGAYRTNNPSRAFEIRILRYLLGDEAIKAEVRDPDSTIRLDFELLTRAASEALSDHAEDAAFQFLHGLGVISEEQCRGIADDLHGNYLAYRLSSRTDEFLLSHFSVAQFDTYKMVPSFEHRLRERDGSLRLVQGNIVEFRDTYAFWGFVTGATGGAPPGMKLALLRRPLYGEMHPKAHLDGIYLSLDRDGSYDVGRLRLVRTVEKYSLDRLGFFPNEQLPAAVPLSVLKVDLSDVHNDALEELKQQAAFLASSINFKLSLDDGD